MVEHYSAPMNFEEALNHWKGLTFESVVLPRIDDLCDLHQRLFIGEDFTRGELKQSPNFVPTHGGQYVWFSPPENVRAEYQTLVSEALELRKHFSLDSSEASLLKKATYVAYFHARLIHIHPFQNGNGRLARFVANFQMWKLYPSALLDGRNCLDRDRFLVNEYDEIYYLTAIHRAPEELSPLVRYFLPPNSGTLPPSIPPPFQIPRKTRERPPEQGEQW